MSFFSGTISTLEQALTYSTMKHELIAQNIANADTPNYKVKSTSFKKLLHQSASAQQDKNSNERHIPLKQRDHTLNDFRISRLRYGHDGNGVDIDKEMSELAANQIYFNAITDRLNGKFSTLQTVIKGGK